MDARTARLAAALKENLKRRKTRARAKATSTQSEPEAASPTHPKSAPKHG